jgi:hypothetical protein
MFNGWSQFAERHWIVGGTLASLLWSLAAKQSLSNRRADAAIFWQSVTVIIMLVACGWAVAQREWLGLAFAVAVLGMEENIYNTRRPALKQSSTMQSVLRNVVDHERRLAHRPLPTPTQQCTGTVTVEGCPCTVPPMTGVAVLAKKFVSPV